MLDYQTYSLYLSSSKMYTIDYYNKEMSDSKPKVQSEKVKCFWLSKNEINLFPLFLGVAEFVLENNWSLFRYFFCSLRPVFMLKLFAPNAQIKWRISVVHMFSVSFVQSCEKNRKFGRGNPASNSCSLGNGIIYGYDVSSHVNSITELRSEPNVITCEWWSRWWSIFADIYHTNHI